MIHLPGNIKWTSTRLISLNEQLQDVILAVHQASIGIWVVLAYFLIESIDNLGQMALEDLKEQTLTAQE